MNQSKNVVIVGGGIGGLTAALALLRRGIDVQVYDQSNQLKEIGAGIQISSNGSRVLFALGLEDALKRRFRSGRNGGCCATGAPAKHGTGLTSATEASSASARRISCCTGAICMVCLPTRCDR